MRRFVFSLALCYFVLVFFSPFSIAITSHGEEGANLSAFRAFVRFALVKFCLTLGLGRAAACDCCPPLTFLLPFLVYKFRKKYMLAMILALNLVKSVFDI